MLKLAKPYQDQINKAYIHIIENEEQYKFFNLASYWNFDEKIPDDEWSSIYTNRQENSAIFSR